MIGKYSAEIKLKKELKEIIKKEKKKLKELNELTLQRKILNNSMVNLLYRTIKFGVDDDDLRKQLLSIIKDYKKEMDKIKF